jgi:hypothetical protein
MVNVEVEGHSSWGLSRKNREKAGCSLASRIPMLICLARKKKKKTRFDGISVIFLNIREGRFETRSPRFVDEDQHRDSRGCFFFVVF